MANQTGVDLTAALIGTLERKSREAEKAQPDAGR